VSREQDQKLVNAYERIVKGEPPQLNEASIDEYKKSMDDMTDKLRAADKLWFKLKKSIKDDIDIPIKSKYQIQKSIQDVDSSWHNVYATTRNIFSQLRLNLESTSIDEAKKREFTKTLGNWFSTRFKNMKGSVKDLEEAIAEKNPNAIRASLTGIKSIMTVMDHALENISEVEEIVEQLNEAEKRWTKNPYQFKRDMAENLREIARWIDNIHVTDRYYPGDVDHSPKEKAYVDRVFKLMSDAVFKLETALLQAKKIRMY